MIKNHFQNDKKSEANSDIPYITSPLMIKNHFQNYKKSEANSLRKYVKKKEIRRSASAYYKYKVKEMFSTKPKQWYNS